MQSEAVQGDPHFIHKTKYARARIIAKNIFCLRTLIITMFTLCSFAFEWVITLNWHNELLGTENVVSRRHIFLAANKLSFQRARKDFFLIDESQKRTNESTGCDRNVLTRIYEALLFYVFTMRDLFLMRS